jgi:hypothetical protein
MTQLKARRINNIACLLPPLVLGSSPGERTSGRDLVLAIRPRKIPFTYFRTPLELLHTFRGIPKERHALRLPMSARSSDIHPIVFLPLKLQLHLWWWLSADLFEVLDRESALRADPFAACAWRSCFSDDLDWHFLTS